VKLVLFQTSAKAPVQPGLITERGVVSIANAVKKHAGHTPTETMIGIIDNFAKLKPALKKLEKSGRAVPLSKVRLRAPLMRPGKILACIGNYWEHQEREPRPPNMFLKNPDCVIGPGDTIVLPEFTEPWVFHHEAELAIVIKGPAKKVSQKNWRKAVFGYTGMIDVSARGEGRFTWKRGSWMGKSFDTFGPIGPCIVTADEVPDPNKLHVRFWNDGQLRHDYNTNDMENRVPKLIEWASTIMTLNSGDIIACGTNHEGLGPLQDGEKVAFEVEKVGRMTLKVRDPLKRKWERGVYMGPNSTNPEAVRKAREEAARQAAQ
jgi:2-keto-4-pentenoate hydratase/2-oxohepta-3-ene-1,7-dioic acid hydratase in catechol pathway